MKFDVTSMDGIEPTFEQLDREVFPGVANEHNVSIAGHLFDRTPAALIRGVVTERGILSPSSCAGVMQRMQTSDALLSSLKSRAK